jgi:hypothetical protein
MRSKPIHVSKAKGAQIMKTTDGLSELSSLERGLLYLPAAAGILFGLLPLVLGGAFGRLVGYSGDDGFIDRLAGAATLGYGVALIMGLSQRGWSPLRLLVIATLTFNLASIYACVAAIVTGTANWFSYLITAVSVLFILVTAWVLSRHSAMPQPARDVPQKTTRGLGLGVILSGVFGLLPLLAPVFLARLVGFRGTDVFIIREAGAASLGYAVMAYFGIRSGAWQQLRLPFVMALVFNATSLVAAIVAILSHDPILIAVVIGAAGLFVTVTSTMTLQRQGQ